MSIKLRSACDKCHETKVRCSGEVPCQGCLTSSSLCFYSVSNPLGRPRGTKKKQIRGGSKGANTWERDDVANGEVAATTAGTGERGSSKRSRTNNGDCSGPASRTIIVSNSHREDTSDPLGSGGSAPGDNSSFIPTHQGHNNISMSDAAAPNDFRLNPMNHSGKENRGIDDALPHSFDYSDLNRYVMSDVARSDFSSLTNPEIRTPITWDDSAFSFDSENSSDVLRTGAENLDFSYTFKVR